MGSARAGLTRTGALFRGFLFVLIKKVLGGLYSYFSGVFLLAMCLRKGHAQR
jgi:hypothetical protein